MFDSDALRHNAISLLWNALASGVPFAAGYAAAEHHPAWGLCAVLWVIAAPMVMAQLVDDGGDDDD